MTLTRLARCRDNPCSLPRFRESTELLCNARFLLQYLSAPDDLRGHFCFYHHGRRGLAVASIANAATAPVTTPIAKPSHIIVLCPVGASVRADAPGAAAARSRAPGSRSGFRAECHAPVAAGAHAERRHAFRSARSRFLGLILRPWRPALALHCWLGRQFGWPATSLRCLYRLRRHNLLYYRDEA